jgi:hypothetical protein
MATSVWRNAYLLIGADSDLTDHIKSLTSNEGSESGDDTAMADTTRSAKAGLITYSLDVEFHQDFATAKVDAVLRALVGAAAFDVIWRPDTAEASATNPQRNCKMVLESYVPGSGAVGTVPLAATARFVAAGNFTITP